MGIDKFQVSIHASPQMTDIPLPLQGPPVPSASSLLPGSPFRYTVGGGTPAPIEP